MTTEKKNTFCLLFFLSLIVLTLRLCFISDMEGPFVFPDQVGYWGHAANLNNLPWQNATASWYSYGYSILLTPLYWISHDMGIMYKLSIALNALLGLISFYLGIAILRELENKIEFETIALISFAASCYSAYLFQTYIGWPETIIYTGVLLVIWSIIKFCKKTTIFKMLIVIIELGMLYIIHNRNIVGTIAFFILLTAMFFTGKIEWQKITIALFSFACIYLINKMMRMYFTQLMLGDTLEFVHNDVSTTMRSLSSILHQADGWKQLLLSLLGKIWYLLTSTFMLTYTGFIFILREMIKQFKTKEKKISDTIFIYFFIALLILGTVAINALFMVPEEIDYSQSTRLDVFFYGRYSDGISGLLIILGLFSLVKTKKLSFRETLTGIGIYCLCAGILYLQINEIKDYWINSMQVPGVYFFEELTIELIKAMSIIIIFIYLIGSVGKMMLIKKYDKTKELTVMTVSIFAALIFWMIGIHGIRSCIIPGQNWGGYYSEVYDVLNNNTTNKIFFLLNDANGTRFILRTRAVEGEFYYNQLPEADEENYFIIISDEDETNKIDLLSKDYYVVCHSEEIYLICEGQNLLQSLTEQGYHCQKITDYSTEKINNGVTYHLKTEDMVLLEQIFEKQLLRAENLIVKDDVALFESNSNISFIDNMDSNKACTHFKLSMDIYFSNKNNVEIINKWLGWQQQMTFAFSWHQNEERYYLNISDDGENVKTYSWGLEEMPKNQWNALEVNFSEGRIKVSLNGNCIIEEECDFTNLYVSSRPITIGNGMVGKIKNFEYEIY